MPLAPRSSLLKHRALLIDPSSRWAAPLKQALADLPCRVTPWLPDCQQLAQCPDALAQLAAHWQRPGHFPMLVFYHCRPDNLDFLRFWAQAEFSLPLPPLIALLDSLDVAAAERLRQLGCVQVHAGFHTWDRLVKTVTPIFQTPVYSDQNLEELVSANLPWSL
jgi:hypothetical protein